MEFKKTRQAQWEEDNLLIEESIIEAVTYRKKGNEIIAVRKEKKENLGKIFRYIHDFEFEFGYGAKIDENVLYINTFFNGGTYQCGPAKLVYSTNEIREIIYINYKTASFWLKNVPLQPSSDYFQKCKDLSDNISGLGKY